MKHFFVLFTFAVLCGFLYSDTAFVLATTTDTTGSSSAASSQNPCRQVSSGEVICDLQSPGSPSEQSSSPPVNPVSADTQSPGFTAIAPIPGLTDSTSADLASFFQKLYMFIIGIAAVLAVIQIIRGGIEISTESIAKHTEGKKHIGFAIFGLVLVLSPVLVFSIINPSILNFSVFNNLGEIKSSPVSFSGTTGGGAGAVPTTTTDDGCRVTGSAHILQVAHCSTMESARNWAASCPSGMRASEPATISEESTDGVQRTTTTTFAVTCSTSFDYFFLTQRGGSPDRLFSEAPTTSGGAGSNNATYAKQFANTCKQTGLPDVEVCMERKRAGRQECPSSITDFRDISGCGWYALSCKKTSFTDVLDNCSNDHLWMNNPPYTPPQTTPQ